MQANETPAPLRLADGTLINPVDGKRIRTVENKTLVEVPTHQEAVEAVTAHRKRLHDLPDVPSRVTPVAAILVYKLFGLNDYDTAMAMGCSEDRIKSIVASTVYRQLSEQVASTIAERDVDDVRNMFKKASKKAARNLEAFMDSENESIALAATKDILDRAGHTPAQLVQHQHTMQGGLEIILKKPDNTQLIEGDFTYE